VFSWVVIITVLILLTLVYGWWFFIPFMAFCIVVLSIGWKYGNLANTARMNTLRPVKPGLIRTDSSGSDMSSSDDSREKFDSQADVVIGRGRKTLALIGQVSTWYEADENHADAIAKSEQLRSFLRQFCDEWDGLANLYNANQLVWRDEETQRFAEAGDLKKLIDGKLRQLEAMGFSH
jgi:hypothetical protein